MSLVSTRPPVRDATYIFPSAPRSIQSCEPLSITSNNIKGSSRAAGREFTDNLDFARAGARGLVKPRPLPRIRRVWITNSPKLDTRSGSPFSRSHYKHGRGRPGSRQRTGVRRPRSGSPRIVTTAVDACRTAASEPDGSSSNRISIQPECLLFVAEPTSAPGAKRTLEQRSATAAFGQTPAVADPRL